MPQQNQKRLKTIWQIPDEQCQQVKQILDDYDLPNLIGRKRIDARAALDAIIFRLRSGCQWNQLPDKFPDDSSVHRTWRALGTEWGVRADLGNFKLRSAKNWLDWRGQSADAAMAKARFGGDETGANPTDRAKPGTKQSLLVEADGGPLAVVASHAFRR